jgi:tRNA threonylcarbamoyladenosine biosynthesis protein TsaB
MATRLLALETSGDLGSVALFNDGAVSERTISSPREQTDSVLPHIQDLLAVAGLELGDLDGIAFGRGPGSFTGLRVATSVAHGFEPRGTRTRHLALSRPGSLRCLCRRANG